MTKVRMAMALRSLLRRKRIRKGVPRAMTSEGQPRWAWVPKKGVCRMRARGERRKVRAGVGRRGGGGCQKRGFGGRGGGGEGGRGGGGGGRRRDAADTAAETAARLA